MTYEQLRYPLLVIRKYLKQTVNLQQQHLTFLRMLYQYETLL